MAPLRVFSAGSNAHGQLANDTLIDSHTFQPSLFACDDNRSYDVPGERIILMTSGANHTLLLLECHSEGCERRTQLWGCGDGRKGQLGPRHSSESSGLHDSSVFRRIDHEILDAAGVDEAEYVIHSIAASWESTYVVLRLRHGASQNGRDIVLSMGNDDYGDLGVDLSSFTSGTRHGPHQVAFDVLLKSSREELLSGFHVMHIAAGPHHVVATVRVFIEGGERDMVIGWGACRHGQLGTEDRFQRSERHLTTTGPRLISTGQTHPDNNPDAVDSCALGNHHTVLFHHSGRVTGLGSNKKGQLTGLREELGLKSVHCTWNGTYRVTGAGDSGQRATFTSVGWEIRATGSHDRGQLGSDSGPSSSTSGTQITHFPFDHTTHHLLDIACGSEHVLALFSRIGNEKTDGVEATEVWAWGWNEHGNLGLGHAADARLPVMVWPQDGQASGSVLGIWAGCGTSWIVEAR